MIELKHSPPPSEKDHESPLHWKNVPFHAVNVRLEMGEPIISARAKYDRYRRTKYWAICYSLGLIPQPL